MFNIFSMIGFGGAALIVIAAVLVLVALFVAMKLRTVVETNAVHVVQRVKKTEVYGKGKECGNVYYKWPSSWPRLGITTKIMPTSIFDIELSGYEAYDVGRVPFKVDIKAFFNVENPETAAQKVENFTELRQQLSDILKGAVRKILAADELDNIMAGRGTFGEAFTKEVKDQLTAWGVSTVKNIEFMDIKDVADSQVIMNIMAKKKSFIERESRIEVAQNMQAASEKEIEAQRQVDLQTQDAEEQVGKRTSMKQQAIGIAEEEAQQHIKEASLLTKQKHMAVEKYEYETKAAIDKNVAVIAAEQSKETLAIEAETKLMQAQKIAEGDLVAQQKRAEGIRAVGAAEADAASAMEMAPVTAKIALAKEIGENAAYLEYLIKTKGLDVGQVVGEANANALAKGDLKIIANSGDVQGGVNSLLDIFSAKGGASIAGMVESLSQSDAGKAIINKLTGNKPVADKVVSDETVADVASKFSVGELADITSDKV